MRILVTGATGFVGQKLLPRLKRDGHEVVVVSRDGESAKAKLGELVVAAHSWAASAETVPAAALEGVEAIVHLAGEPVAGRWTRDKREAIRASRVEGTRNLVAGIEAMATRPRVLLSASAIGFYGDRHDDELTEESMGADDFLGEVCAAWEGEAKRAVDLGLRSVQMRLGLVMGKGGGPLDEMLKPARLGINGPLGSGEQWWSWIHIDDIVEAMVFLLGREDIDGPVNLTAPGPVRQKHFAQILGKVIRRPSWLPAPAFALRAVLGAFSVEILSSKKVLPARLLKAGYSFGFAELDAALRDLLD